MNNYRIHYFGPMLFQTELSNEQATSIESLLNKKEENNFQAQLAGHLKDEFLINSVALENILLPTFESFYEAHQKFYGKKLMQQFVKRAWVNYMKSGDYNPIHAHSECDWSAVIYFKIPQGLQDEQKKHVANSQAPGGITFMYDLIPIRFSYGQLNFTPKEKTIFIFPAELCHEVTPFKSDGERITIAFNLKSRE